jgi:hypothetical protein
MREILFRGKQAYNDEWAFSEYPFGTIHCGAVVHDFIPETVGQYTGLTDKNGKKIFEGDIINGYTLNGDRDFRNAVVWWSDVLLCYRAANNTLFGGCAADEYEVVGNIHDYPELLEERI